MNKVIVCFGIALAILIGFISPSFAIPRPVRIAIVAATGSGSEQQVVDNLSAQLQGNGYIVISTVNPDWFINCKIDDQTDIASLTVRVNGTVTIKNALDGAVLNTISAQANKQDFNAGGGPTPLNKALVTSAMREVVQELAQRSVQPIEDAVVTEMNARETLSKVRILADQDKYEDALNTLRTITRDSPHFWPAHELEAKLQMEQEAFKLVTGARAKAKRGQYQAASIDLHQVSPKSKRYKIAQAMIASFPKPH